jgi:hypothetical protein
MASLQCPRKEVPSLRGSVFSLTLATVCVVALVGAVAGAGGSSASMPRWQVFATRVPDLVAVDARSSSDVWAVGDGIVHWDGRTLRVTPLPWKNATLTGVSAVSSGDVWTVGNISSGKYRNAHEIPISAHWDGRSWRRIPLPTVAARYVWLADVVASAPRDVWAVGGWGENKTRPLLMHWDGSRWHRIDLLQVAPVLGQLNAIDARTPSDVWAAGMEGDWREESYGYTDYVLHWDGRSWRRVGSPLEAAESSGPFAQAMDVGLTGEVWTLNYDLSGNGPFFVRWSSPGRTARAFDWMTYESYEDVAAVSSTDVWLVGQSESAEPLIAQWNGTSWRVQHTPFERYTHVGLYGVSAASAHDIWGVGNHLIVRFAR